MPKFIVAVSNNMYDDIYNDLPENFIFINDHNELSYELLKEMKPKYVFFPHWSYLIPAEIYSNFNCVIFHMTDLPFGRGGSPLQNLLARGIYKTKISAIKCVAELDAGDIYMKKDFDISHGSARDIYIRSGVIIKEMILEIAFIKPIAIPQSGDVVCFDRRKPQESNIAGLESINEVFDYIRMLDADGYPKAFLKNANFTFEFSQAECNNDEIVARVVIKEGNNEE